MKEWVSPIDKKFHFVWIGNQEKPDYFLLFLERFKELCPEFKIKVWGNSNLNKKNFPITYPYIKKIRKLQGGPVRGWSSGSFINDSKGESLIYSKWAQITDLMRLEIIYTHGGYYFDTNIECLKPLFDLLNIPKKRFVGCNESTYPFKKISYLSNSFFGATKNNIILKRLLSKRRLNNIDYYWMKPNETTGPYYLRSGIQMKDNYHIFPSEYFYPFVEFETDGRKVMPNKCHSHKRNIKRTIKKNRRKRTISKSYKTNKSLKLKNKKGYLYFPCDKYPKSYALKHWNLGKSWL